MSNYPESQLAKSIAEDRSRRYLGLTVLVRSKKPSRRGTEDQAARPNPSITGVLLSAARTEAGFLI